MMAEEILKIKHVISGIGILEMKILKIPAGKFYPEGIKYSLTFVRELENGEFDNQFLRYDNYNREGHHKHIRGIKEKYEFVDVEKLIEDFKEDLEKLLKEENVDVEIL